MKLELPRGRLLDLSIPKVMGVLNLTPDSFSDGGHYAAPSQAVDAALRMIEEGAAIIDVGGESTRPGASPVSVDEECRRVLPVIAALRGHSDVVISIDTRNPPVMAAACAAGADIINDVNALRAEGALAVARESGAAVCLMHMRGTPATMQDAPCYDDAVREICGFLAERLQVATAAGIPPQRLLVDPGFGFGKRLEDNLALLAALRHIGRLGVPMLVGMSRKGMLGQLTGRAVDQRVAAGTAAAAIAVLHGAAIVRTHDVGATLDAVRVAHAVRLATLAAATPS